MAKKGIVQIFSIKSSQTLNLFKSFSLLLVELIFFKENRVYFLCGKQLYIINTYPVICDIIN